MPSVVPVAIFRPDGRPTVTAGRGPLRRVGSRRSPALALLELRRWPQAARTFEEAPDAAQSGTLLELAGAARWLAGEREIAVERWAAALDAPYEGPASRVKPPALLIYAGTRMGDERFVLRGTRLLTKGWKPKIQRIWPGPIAGFLLGYIDETSFLEDGYDDPDLEARRLASAHFWAALKDPQKAKQHYEAAIASEGARRSIPRSQLRAATLVAVRHRSKRWFMRLTLAM